MQMYSVFLGFFCCFSVFCFLFSPLSREGGRVDMESCTVKGQQARDVGLWVAACLVHQGRVSVPL